MRMFIIAAFICMTVLLGGCSVLDEKIYQTFAEDAAKGKALKTIKITDTEYVVLVCIEKKELHLVHLKEDGIYYLIPQIKNDELIKNASCS